MALEDAGEAVRAALPVDHAAAHRQLRAILRNKGRMLLHRKDAAESRPLSDRRTQDEILGRARRQMNAMIEMRRERRVALRLLPRRTARKDLRPRAPDALDGKGPQVGEHDKVGDAAGRDGALVPEPHVLRGRIGRRIDRLLRREAELDAPLHEMVELPAPHEVVRHCVVRDEGKAPG